MNLEIILYSLPVVFGICGFIFVAFLKYIDREDKFDIGFSVVSICVTAIVLTLILMNTYESKDDIVIRLESELEKCHDNHNELKNRIENFTKDKY